MTLAAAPQTIAGYYDSIKGKVQTGPRMGFGQNIGYAGFRVATQPFINWVKSGEISANTTGLLPDANGYLDTTGGGLWEVSIRKNDNPPGLYKLRWTGTADAVYLGNNTTTEGDTDLTPPNQYRTYTINAGVTSNSTIRISGGTCTSLEFFLVSEEAALDAGEVLTGDFKLDMAGVPVVRTMQWQSTNNNRVRYVADQMPYSNLTWQELEPAYIQDVVPIRACCETANELGCDLWLCIPHQAVDALVNDIATTVDTYLDIAGGRKVWIELSNEVWNSASAFHDEWAWYSYDAVGNGVIDVVCDPTDGSCNSPLHGLTTEDELICFSSMVDMDYPYTRGGEDAAYALVDDVNNFRLMQNGGFGKNSNITDITTASLCNVECINHGYENETTNQLVLLGLGGASGMDELEGYEGAFTVVDADNFTLDGVNSTGFVPYVSGGRTYLIPALTQPNDGSVNWADASTGAIQLRYISGEGVDSGGTARDVNYATRCMEVWDLCKAILGDAMYKIGAGKSGSGTLTNQLLVPGYRAAFDFYATAPYFDFDPLNDHPPSFDDYTFAELADYMIDVDGPNELAKMEGVIAVLGHTRLVHYEAGEENGDTSGQTASEDDQVTGFARDAEVIRAYDYYWQMLAQNGVKMTCDYMSHGQYTGAGTFGNMEQPRATTAAKYVAVKPYLDNGGVPKP